MLVLNDISMICIKICHSNTNKPNHMHCITPVHLHVLLSASRADVIIHTHCKVGNKCGSGNTNILVVG